MSLDADGLTPLVKAVLVGWSIQVANAPPRAVAKTSAGRIRGGRILKKLALAFSISVLIASPTFAKEHIANLVKKEQGIFWNATPRDYPEKVTSKDSVLWVGVIEEADAYINDKKETVLEYLCRHLSLQNASSDGLIEPIKATESHAGYFVISVKSPSLPLKEAKECVEEIHKVKHYAIMLGEPVARRTFHGRSAVYVHGKVAEMSDELNIQIIK